MVQAVEDPQTTMQMLEQSIQDALINAQTLSETSGINSAEAILAWSAVEELLVEKANLKKVHPETDFERFCDANPGRPECLVYDV